MRRAVGPGAGVRGQLAERQRRAPTDGAGSGQHAGRSRAEERRDTTTATAPVRTRHQGALSQQRVTLAIVYSR